MDESNIKSQIAWFNKIIVEEVEYHFQEYIVMDMLEAGETYLIDDYSWYLHWLDVLRDLSQFIDRLIQEHYDGRKELRAYLEECIPLE